MQPSETASSPMPAGNAASSGSFDFSFLSRRGPQLLLVALVLHATAYYSFLRPEPPVNAKPLAQFPNQVSEWTQVGEFPVEPEVQEVLKADDTLSRAYASATQPAQAGLFVAFFRSQQAGQAPHSPKNCLPGSGWEQVKSGTIQIPIAGRTEPIEINRYIVARGDNKSMVFYWYQSHGRVVASEYWSKIYLVWDSMHSHRSDTALVRIVVPVINSDEAAAEKTATEFVRASFGGLANLLPS
jgi:EpsI family protein